MNSHPKNAILSLLLIMVALLPTWGQDASPDPSSPPDAGALAFQVSALPEVPKAYAPPVSISSDLPHAKIPEKMGAVKMNDFPSVDIDTLGKYDEVVKFDKSNAVPEDKAAKWRALGAEVEAFSNVATKRAALWDGYAPQVAFDTVLERDKSAFPPAIKAAKWRELSDKYPQFAQVAQRRAEEWERYDKELAAVRFTQEQRGELRDKDWSKLGKLLSFSIVDERDKRKYALDFVRAYGRNAWDNPYGSELAPYLPRENLRFPFDIKSGMNGQEVVELLGEEPEKDTTRWPMAGQIAFKTFHPSFLVLHTDFNSPGWQGAKGDARRSALNKSSDFKVMMADYDKLDKEQYGYATSGKAYSVGLYQDIPDCDSLRSVLADAAEYVNSTYAVTEKKVPPDDTDYAKAWNGETRDCLGEGHAFTWIGEHGYGIDLTAGNNHGDQIEKMGVFFVMLDYTEVVGRTSKTRHPAKTAP